MLTQWIDAFNVVQDKYPNLVAIDSTGGTTGNIVDFCEYRDDSAPSRIDC
jgi:hypothetical protein